MSIRRKTKTRKNMSNFLKNEGENSGFDKGSLTWVLEQIKNMKFEFVKLKSCTAIQATHDDRKFFISAISCKNIIDDDIYTTMEKVTRRQFVAYISSDYGFYESVYIFNCHLSEISEEILTDFRKKISQIHENLVNDYFVFPVIIEISLVNNDFDFPVKIEISSEIK